MRCVTALMRLSKLVHSTICKAIFCFLFLQADLMLPWAQSAPKRRVAVFDFYTTATQSGIADASPQTTTSTSTAPRTGIAGGAPPQANAQDLGKGIAELLIIKLAQDGNVSVVEQNGIDKILAEQNLTNSNRADPTTAAKVGRILGVDGIILGTVTHYDYQEKMSGGNAARNLARAFTHGGTSFIVRYNVAAKVEISASLISSDTAEVLAVSQGVGEANLKAKRVDTLDPYGRVIMTSGGSSSTLNACTDKAVAQLVAQLETQFTKLPQHKNIVEGVIADASDSGKLILNVGAQQGIKIGDRFDVLRAGQEVRDPVTGKLLTRNDALLGEAIVTSVNDIFCVAQYSGSERLKIGDLVRSALPKQ
jgi:curli biogenesis system outer membrane secretion channel CsgG